jgi:hypothetical protein
MPPKPIPPELLNLRRHNALALFVRWRLQEIAQGRTGGDKAFAEAMGIDNAHWSRLKAGTPLGPRLARRLEAARVVEEGWLCWGRFKIDHVGRLNFDQGPEPGFWHPVVDNYTFKAVS